ncbi:MAG TPA: AAA domain-containing protein [Pyrinomonadaceae bacterium]|nr:AAA domain-containing protein [Pyrinomonadaceae bacterium]
MSSQAKQERTLTAERLAQYVARGRCERHLRFALFPSEARRLLERFGLEIEPLSPLLSKEGQEYEREQFEELRRREARVADLRNRAPGDFVAHLRAQDEGRSFYYQPSLAGSIGAWACEGRPDLVLVERGPSGRVRATVIDIKASRRETVGYRLQVAFYARLLAAALREAGLEVEEVCGAVAARDSLLREDGTWETFELALFDDEIERLVADPDSDVARAAGATHATARYHLRPSCDGCPYNQLCFADTAEREDLSLVPLLTLSEKRALAAEGVTTARALARLMDYGARGGVEPAEGRDVEVRRISARWPLTGRLPLLVQRARAAVGRSDRSVNSKRYLVGADYGSLPCPTRYPDLVRVFVDAQRDYITDRLYMVAASVVGPAGTADVVEMTDAPPDDDSERAALVAWVQKLLPEVARAAGATHAPLHVYTYAGRGERALLDALARHFDALCAIPAFYDLLTSSPALSQGVLSLLSEEVSARMNLAPVCQNLYEVAAALGFRWRDDETDFRRRFRARVFDNRRAFMRDADGSLRRRDVSAAAPGDDADDDAPPPFFAVESAARFGTEIPLEYAYAAWGLLPARRDPQTPARAQSRGFAGVTREDLKTFARARLGAMRHVEESFQFKNKRVEKEPFDLSRLDRVAVEPEEVPLHRSLEDFLLLEHHAAFQERLLHLSLSPRERAQTGRTLLLRCESYEKSEDRTERARFRFADPEGRELSVEDLGLVRLRADDWVVVNPLADAEGRALPAWRLVRGRLATVEEISSEGVRLRLLPMSFKNSPFRYPHTLFAPDAGALYTLDEMADDLNSDKFLEACRHAASNHLYAWMSDPEEGRRPRVVRPKRLRDAAALAELASETQAPHGLTDAQKEIVGARLTERVLVVQGPPGTGKSHTLGFAAVVRALALASPARPFRVAVLAKTHAAVRVALESIAKRRVELLDAARALPADSPLAPLLAPLRRARLAKICNDEGEETPRGVEAVTPSGGADSTAAEQWAELLTEPLLVVGGTPGGLYRLVKEGASKGRALDWAAEHFDLVIVDEASQMGLAEALTAAAFLRGDGQFVAVGDHRQMPPILAHAWDREARRDVQRARPHLSVFEYLRALDFPRAALDRSFRVPAPVADFLRRHVYAEDGIDFRAAADRRLEGAAGECEAWLAAALAPEHALVVVEHDESGSQQSNEFEAALVERVVREAFARFPLDAREGVGVVVPHRAQKALLAARLPELADSIDTVERFQGGERDLVVLSATVSDREFAAGESGFLLEPRRLTVAVSRPRRKLVVIASRAVFDLIPSDLDEYERGALWKHLRRESQARTLWRGEVAGHRVTVRAV